MAHPVGLRALNAVPEDGNSVVLQLDASRATRAPAVRFTARVDRPHIFQLGVAAEGWDIDGTTLRVSAGGAYPIALVR